MTPDLAARRIICAAYCYYVFDVSLMTDGEYDNLSEFVADHWAELHPDRQWCLGSPQETRSSGFHIRFTASAVYAARSAYASHEGRDPDKPPPQTWRARGDGLRYVTTEPH